ncbi:hypothetical protein N7541_006766 [Penicillium brevicompactum]|uniref:Uncharacterized protein n=1 Tax=Penicillium brevicompactum TaxID=5074 RepID=A0A9W9R5Q0_PENBR|nr:hypothetical protein N7541_006766 [Penicillium brevicompactum]
MSVEFVCFIMRLWRQPELASRVRRLEIDWMECGRYSIDKLKIDKLKEDTDVVSFIQEALDEIFTPEEKKMRSEWEKHLDLNDLCTEAWLGLLLVRTNNLRTIEFTHHVSELMSDILHKAANRQRPFHKATPFPYLQEVRGCTSWVDGWIDSGFLTPFFYLPAVRNIYVSIIGENRYDENTTLNRRYRSNQVREIIVDEAYWCRELERVSLKIELQMDDQANEIPDDMKFDASLCRAGLLHSAATLKSLHISYGGWYINQLLEHETPDAPFGSFRDFVVLEELLVRHSHLGNNTQPLVEILPTSLKHLEVIDLIGRDDDQVQLVSDLSDLLHQGGCENLERLD